MELPTGRLVLSSMLLFVLSTRLVTGGFRVGFLTRSSTTTAAAISTTLGLATFTSIRVVASLAIAALSITGEKGCCLSDLVVPSFDKIFLG